MPTKPREKVVTSRGFSPSGVILASLQENHYDAKRRLEFPIRRSRVQTLRAIQLFFGAAIVALIAMMPSAALAQVGTSCEDCPNYKGAFSIENSTGVTIEYQYRWGNRHPWQTMVLRSGRIGQHSYPLGEDPHKKVPTPYVRFDRIAGDGILTIQEYKMSFHAVGYAGYGARQNSAQPKRFVFRFAANGRDLDLKTKQ